MTDQELECELVMIRLIDAPCEKVYRAWTDASLLRQWFAQRQQPQQEH